MAFPFGAAPPPRSPFVLRLLPNGEPNPAFQGGTVLLPPDTELRDIVLQPDDKLVVAGSSGPSLARLILDSSFAMEGYPHHHAGHQVSIAYSAI